MSGRADIIALARTLGLGAVNDVLLSQYYTEALIAFGMDTEILLEPRMLTVTQGVAVYEIPDTNRIAGAFFGNHELTKTTLEHLETFDPSYRTHQGTPRVWCEEHENFNFIRLYPVPDTTSVAQNVFPDNFGLQYPDDRLVVFAADSDETAAPWLDYPLACAILARELTHQSSYRAPETAAAAQKLGQLARAAGGPP